MKKQADNYLERKPKRVEHIRWTTDDADVVTLEIENKGFMNRVCQKLFKKPPVTYVHLDEMGSFIWPLLDGEQDIVALGVMVKEHFGEKAEPIYERLVKFFQILESYSFISWS